MLIKNPNFIITQTARNQSDKIKRCSIYFCQKVDLTYIIYTIKFHFIYYFTHIINYIRTINLSSLYTPEEFD